MSLLRDFLHRKKQSEIVVLIDIGPDSVAGAYAQYTGGEKPPRHYTRRLPIEIRKGEPHEEAMLRALGALGDALISEGAPVLVRAVGSASVGTVLVSIDAPWQTTSVRTEYLEQDESFTFTRDMGIGALKNTSTASAGKMLADESIIGTILNGYETRDPYGKRAHRASIIVLTSLIDEQVAKSIHEALRRLYHTKKILTISGSSLRYQALCIAFPHERDALILDATGPLTSIALIRRDLLMDIIEVPGTPDTAAWLKNISGKLARLAERFPLPRTIFLLTKEKDLASERKTLDVANLGSLWLSDNPPTIISLLRSHIIGLVQEEASVTPDLPLLLMALYYQSRTPEGSLPVDK